MGSANVLRDRGFRLLLNNKLLLFLGKRNNASFAKDFFEEALRLPDFKVELTLLSLEFQKAPGATPYAFDFNTVHNSRIDQRRADRC